MHKGLFNLAWVMAILATSVSCAQLEVSYEDSVAALLWGNVASDMWSEGVAWLNVTGFAPAKLPNVQNNVGLLSLDNWEGLNAIVDLAQVAVNQGLWGDFVLLWSAFLLNGWSESLNVSSVQIKEALWKAVADQTSGEVDANLVELYANTSSSESLRKIFADLQSDANREDRDWNKVVCSGSNQAEKSHCASLIDYVQRSPDRVKWGVRAVCWRNCCISWNQNASFEMGLLYNAARACIDTCTRSDHVSCRATEVSLEGTVVNQCLSNRAEGC
ncbi:hypothetical protein N7456_005546 [Penicillium angulare]|uniref:WD-like domain-containing protein n=1 Tax=Penicillium angulare TaxID=116970 RepID=A0A9W9KKA4_9EURO|nr:hypothetical protein N7456_005546 [Penicillium angulare]